MESNQIGVSAAALYVPPYRVRLEHLASWTGADFEKLSAVVGRSFRMAGPDENVYTMAAAAALRLIAQNDIDPARIGFLALGTESSTDNAAGAIIVKGLIDLGLRARGLPPLPRSCEVPELKHACLGGIYGLKAAARWLACDGRGREALVLSGDIAEYARGSTGEPTQGAGAVAMHVTESPRLFAIDFQRMGTSSAYRGLDFRKPFRRHTVQGYASGTRRLHDFPVFNGKYSTACYTEAVIQAVRDLANRRAVRPLDLLQGAEHVFLHRPYRKMAQDGLSAVAVAALLDANEPGERGFGGLLGADASALERELSPARDLFNELETRGVDGEAFPELATATRALRSHARFDELVRRKLELGAATMMDLGNLYTAALPAWLASGLEAAAQSGQDLGGRRLLAIGYGSGDAAEAMELLVTPGFETAALRIGLASALAGPIDLTRAEYEAHHDGDTSPGVGESSSPLLQLPKDGGRGVFRIARVGSTNTGRHQDLGIEFYRFIGS